MKTTYGAITQPFIRATMLKKARVLASLIFYETRAKKFSYGVLSCVIYKRIKTYFCIDYLPFQLKNQVKYLLVMRGVLSMETNVLTNDWVLEFYIC